MTLSKRICQFLAAASALCINTSAFADTSCKGGDYRVDVEGRTVSMYVAGTPTFRGLPRITRSQDGYVYYDVSPNIGPQPADIMIEYMLVDPAFPAGSVYTAYLDSRVSSFLPKPSQNVTRTQLICIRS